MENSLATESFSYSWLTDIPPPSPNLRQIEDDNFRFVVPTSTDFVNAGDIFSDGQIKPVYAMGKSPRTEAASVPGRNRYYILSKWRRSSKKILHKWLWYVHRRLRCSRKRSRVDDLQRKVLEASPRRSSSAYSAAEFGDFDYGDEFYCLKIDKSPTSMSPCRSSDVDDNSITEAILYCKKSIEK
ncbi:hypothetical protein SASPL_102553 [Salvia splendens]|uniref:Membrane-associated kinase regulator 6 n=1 Tax=Salvia splendens TaxID=180675 RepID=A0A8X8YW60_SALSN|nr:uncharacterized protein LOC121750991 [Salvia splendens]KAG6437632.1 hypothetical protein SASPL_102553 [Salvia splendens]